LGRRFWGKLNGIQLVIESDHSYEQRSPEGAASRPDSKPPPGGVSFLAQLYVNHDLQSWFCPRCLLAPATYQYRHALQGPKVVQVIYENAGQSFLPGVFKSDTWNQELARTPDLRSQMRPIKGTTRSTRVEPESGTELTCSPTNPMRFLVRFCEFGTSY
jgi:hypothetical protein